jgi:hypothetical protein
MSVRIQSLVWGSALAGTDMLVTQALADNADDEGSAYPSVPYLMWKTGLSRRTIQRTLRALRDSDYIDGDANGGDQSTRYKILIGNLPKKDSWQRLKGREAGRSGRASTPRKDDAPSGSTSRHPVPDPASCTTLPRATYDTTPRQVRPRNKEEPSANHQEPSVEPSGFVADATLFPQEGSSARSPSKKKTFVPPTIEEVAAYCRQRENSVDPQDWWDHYQARGWKYNGGVAMKDWEAAVRTWEKNQHKYKTNGGHGNGRRADSLSFQERAEAELRMAREYARKNPARANGDFTH